MTRAPIWLYRARLGGMFGRRLCMLEHVGRITGRRRYVVLEVIDRPSPDRFMVVAGLGDRAQWLRNVEVTPEIRLFVGSRRPTPAAAQRIGPEAAAASLGRYATAHPRAWAVLAPLVAETLETRVEDVATALPVVAVDIGVSGPGRGGGER